MLTVTLLASVYLRRRVGLKVFLGGNIKILNILKISPWLRGVPLGLRYQGIGYYINLSVVFFSLKWNGSDWA